MVDTDRKESIAVIGDEEFTLGFQLAGIDKSYNPSNYGEKIQELLEKDGIGILVVDENDLDQLSGRVRNKVEGSVDPVVVPLSEEAESDRLNEKISRVIGAEIT